MQSNNSIETYAYGTSKVIVKMITNIITKKKKKQKRLPLIVLQKKTLKKHNPN